MISRDEEQSEDRWSGSVPQGRKIPDVVLSSAVRMQAPNWMGVGSNLAQI